MTDQPLIGHERPWQEWRDALAGDRFPHGWIFSGVRGIGKATFAMQAAREMVAVSGVSQPQEDHPDILRLEPLPATAQEEKKRDEGRPFRLRRNISIDQVRSMQQRLTTRPTLGPRRAVIIDSADLLERSSANALLKSLEEAPSGTYFLLIAHRLERLLPTIRSRCRVLRFPALSSEEIDTLLQKAVPEADDGSRAAAITASGGSPGIAFDFLTLNLGGIYQLMRQIAERGDADFSVRGRLANEIGARPDMRRQIAAIDLARTITAHRMRHTDSASLPLLADTHAELVHLGAQAPTYNYDPGLLILEIGTLLARLAGPRG